MSCLSRSREREREREKHDPVTVIAAVNEVSPATVINLVANAVRGGSGSAADRARLLGQVSELLRSCNL